MGILASSFLAALSSPIEKAADPYTNPASDGGSMMTSDPGQDLDRAPLNVCQFTHVQWYLQRVNLPGYIVKVIISADSSPSVLTSAGLENWAMCGVSFLSDINPGNLFELSLGHSTTASRLYSNPTL